MTSFSPSARMLAVLALLIGAGKAHADAVLSASVVTSSGATVSVGQSFLVTLTVTNTGVVDTATSVTVFLAARTADTGAVTLSGPTPAALGSIPNAGGSVTYTWTATATTRGNVFFTATAAGTDSVGTVNSEEEISTTTLVQTPAALSGSVVVQSATVVCTGNPILVVYTVSNTGDATANGAGVVPVVLIKTAGGAAAALAGPNPAAPFVLPGHNAVRFSFTATGSKAGSVFFTATAAGKDANTGLTVQAASQQSSTVWMTALKGTVAGPTSPVSTGQAFNVTIAVTNWTSGAVGAVTPKIRVATSPASVALLSGPSPASIDLLDPGMSQTFTWSFNPTATAGVVTFSVSAGGSPSCGTLNLVGGSVSASVQTAAALSVTMMATTATATGMPITVRVSVTNTGGATANVVKPAGMTVSATGGTVTGSPAASASVNLASGTNVTFTFTYTAGTIGRIVFSTTVTATDKNSGASLTKFVSYVLLPGVYPPAIAARLSYNRPDLGAGQTVQFILSVTNTGGSTVTNLTAVLSTAGNATVDAAPTPAAVAVLKPGASASFTWNAVPGDAGSLVFNATASGATDKGPVAAATTATLPGIPAPEAASSYVFPSPAGATARIAYTLAGSGNVTIRIYNAVGDRVATVDDTGKPAGLTFTDLTTSGLASGVYFYFVDITYDSGATEKQKKRKFVVLH